MSSRPPVTTHILDLVAGKPAVGVVVRLFAGETLLTQGMTNEDGRVEDWEESFSIDTGRYRLEFEVEPWFEQKGESSFYADVQIAFKVADPDQHYHVPLLLSPYGYSTYRGS